LRKIKNRKEILKKKRENSKSGKNDAMKVSFGMRYIKVI
jgi:hypothetical protein